MDLDSALSKQFQYLLRVNGAKFEYFHTCNYYGYHHQLAWDLRTKLCRIASGKWIVRRVALQEFDNKYILL